MSHLRTAFIQKIALKLNESEHNSISQIERLVERVGPERVVELVREAIAIEKAGGLLVRDGSRRRTLGGVFFYVCQFQAGLSKADRRYVFPPYSPMKTAPALVHSRAVEQELFSVSDSQQGAEKSGSQTFAV